MTGREFMDWAEAYYGAYPEGQRQDVWEYVKVWEPTYLDALREVLKTNHSSQFRTPPDIAAMSKQYGQASALQDKYIRTQGRPAPEPQIRANDAELAAQLRADMKEAGVTFDDPRWFSKTFIHRCKRGDFGPRLKANPPVRVWEPQGARA